MDKKIEALNGFPLIYSGFKGLFNNLPFDIRAVVIGHNIEDLRPPRPLKRYGKSRKYFKGD